MWSAALIKRLQLYTCFLTMRTRRSDISFLTRPGSMITHGQLTRTLLFSRFCFVPSVLLGEKFPTAEFCMISAVTPWWETEKNSQIFKEDFYLPLYLPLWYVPSLELGLPHPLSCKRVYLTPWTGGWGHTRLAGEWVGESQLRRLDKKLSTLSTRWEKSSVFLGSVIIFTVLSPRIICLK